MDRCLELLLSQPNRWVNSTEFVGPEIGGLNATRRLRELREQDDRIETRLAPGTKNTWQWRIVLPGTAIRPHELDEVPYSRSTPQPRPSAIPTRSDELKYGDKRARRAQSSRRGLSARDKRILEEREQRLARRAKREASSD